MINFMSLLGWNPGTEKEIFSLDELIKELSLERVHKGGAVFTLQRLDWLNGYYIRQMDLDRLTKKCLPYRFAQYKPSAVFFRIRLAMVNSPITRSRSAKALSSS